VVKQQGFTLIDLVIVIVVLGILSALALPKFVNLNRDAHIAILEGIKGAIAVTSQLVEMKAKIEGEKNGTIEIDGKTILVNDCYIAGHWN
jgi:MSHA pilin protein MshA